MVYYMASAGGENGVESSLEAAPGSLTRLNAFDVAWGLLLAAALPNSTLIWLAVGVTSCIKKW